MRYHIYWQDKILLKDLDEEEFKNIWEKMHWVYNNELNYVEVIGNKSVLKDDIIKKIVSKNCDNLFCVDLKKSKTEIEKNLSR